MKQLLFSLIACLWLVTACNNDNAGNETTDNSDSTTTEEITPPIEEPTPTPNSDYTQLSSSTYTYKLEAGQTDKFLAYITEKQNDFDGGSRSDTLYAISYLPFKDQELYLYQAVETAGENVGHKWCIMIIKNGEIQAQEHVLSQENFAKVTFTAMQVGDKNLIFTATKADGSTEAITLPYDGKKL